ncbi:hypothetical protein [Pseudomonas carnis]|uniref:hypothetical protein n=1 Tax=Pseudomonas carnis TaxID=2487355 RepID=UPI001BC985E1|nr:hypothetical protein [Pseudomonas carnis]
MQWKVSKNFNYIMAFLVLVCLPLAIKHFREWDSEKISSTCQKDIPTTNVMVNKDIDEKRVIPQSDARPNLTAWKCPDGQVRVTRNSQTKDQAPGVL